MYRGDAENNRNSRFHCDLYCVSYIGYAPGKQIQRLTGTVGGMADSYWGKNKGRSMEGKLVKWTTILTAVFFIITVVLNMNW